MTTEEYLEKLQKSPEAIEFSEIMDVIESEYEFQPSAFKNGDVENSESENLGSCKILSFAKLHDLSVDETLACFGAYYRDDVLQHPANNDHSNIRSFMEHGWSGVEFKRQALTPKAT